MVVFGEKSCCARKEFLQTLLTDALETRSFFPMGPTVPLAGPSRSDIFLFLGCDELFSRKIFFF